ncbi:cell division protein FtsN [Neisseria polysaccharea]|uniref:cell division protein FtsN n=1 Tax=Neisseria polysaccharea TaxID=489 RepID=UPI000D305B72
MSENKQNEVLTGYEQLKRRNRRRLVTASCLVAASCILLAAALSSGPSENDPAEQTAGETSSVENKAAGAAQTPALKSAAENGETAADKPQDLAGEDKPSAADSEISEPENVGAPLVLINDRLEDSNIKGLEASEKLQQEETAQTAPKQAKQRAAEKAPATADSTDTAAVEKPKRTAEAKPKAKETKTAEKVADKPKTAAEKTKPDTAKSDSAVKEAKKADKAEGKKTAEKDHSDGKKHETAQKTDKADKTKTAEKEKSEKSGKKAAIQAGYAEKERALSLQRKMKAAGIDSTITEIMTDNGKVYRVKSSNYKNARDAERDLNKLRVHGIAGQVTNE